MGNLILYYAYALSSTQARLHRKWSVPCRKCASSSEDSLLRFRRHSWDPITMHAGMFIVLLIPSCHQAVIAQLAARRSHNPKVVSSILTRRISYHGTISWDTNTIIGRPQHIHIRQDFGRSLKIRDCGASGPRKYGCKSLSCLLPVINPSIRRNSGINTRSRYLW